MPLSHSEVYDELSGAEAKAILLERVRTLLDSVPDFQKHLTLPRVRMKLWIHLDIYGRRNPSLDLETVLDLRTNEPEERQVISKELQAEDEVSADTGVAVPGTPFDGNGDPPDQVREENGLPTMEPVRDRATQSYSQRPIPTRPDPPAVAPNPPVPPTPPPGGRRYAAFKVLEREGPAVMGYSEYKEDSAPFSKQPSAQMGEREVGLQKDFRDMHRPEEKK